MADQFPFTVAGICSRISARLGDTDDEDGTYDKCLIKTTVNDILSTISIFRPDLFTKSREIELKAGVCGQLVPETCPRIIGYVCVISSNGDEIPVTLGNYTANNRNRSYPQVRLKCKEQPNETLLNIVDFKVGISPVNGRRINIAPIPPMGYTYKLVVECIELGTFTDDEDEQLPSEVRPWIMPIVELALYAMISIDSSDAAAASRAQAHANLFASLSSINLNGLSDVLNNQVGESSGGSV